MLQNQQNSIMRESCKKIQDSNDYIFTLLNFEIIIDAIESNEDGEGHKLVNYSIGQGRKLINYSIEKWYLLDHGLYIVKNLKDCFEQCYNNLFGKDANININFDEGDRVLFDVSCLLNWNVWQNSGKAEEESCDWQLRLFQNTILHYEGMEILTSITEDEIAEGFLSIVRYGLKYFNLTGIGVHDSWAKIFGLKYDNPQWNPS